MSLWRGALRRPRRAGERADLPLPSLPEGHGQPLLRPRPLQGQPGTIRGETASYPSSSELERIFCSRCGTRIGAYRALSDNMALALALFDDPEALTPDAHFFTGFKLGWVETGGLPAYPEWAPD